jgi:DnaJ-class molecular chaperone
VLGLEPGATADDVKRAYCGLMRELHPDVTGDQASTARALEVIEAFAVLADPARRAEFDARSRPRRRRRASTLRLPALRLRRAR